MRQKSPSFSVNKKRNIFLAVLLFFLLLHLSTIEVEARPHPKAPLSSSSLPKTFLESKMTEIPPNIRIKRDSSGPNHDFDDRSSTTHQDDDDIVAFIEYEGGISDSDIFDMRHQHTLVCNLCLWIQPNYAVKQGSGSLSSGIAETLEVLQLLSWTFRALDLNLDMIPDSIALDVGEILVQDFQDLPLTSFSVNESTTEIEGGAGEALTYATHIGRVDPVTMLPFLEEALTSKFLDQHCCATLAFIYHDVPNMLSFTSLRGICSQHNVAVISGHHSGVDKVGFYDIFRATFHALAHLFGAGHDSVDKCGVDHATASGFRNPFLMAPEHLVNVGARPNSMRLSSCSKAEMAVFLSSNLPNCLTTRDETYCGNGVTEEGEECDCGAQWQCLTNTCCGSQDSFSPCKLLNIVQPVKSGRCSRPTEW